MNSLQFLSFIKNSFNFIEKLKNILFIKNSSQNRKKIKFGLLTQYYKPNFLGGLNIKHFKI